LMGFFLFSGVWKGITGKWIKNVVAIGIGGSYLGGEFVAEALKTDSEGEVGASGRKLRFLANVDPVAVKRALFDLDPEETLVVVISKTFTTAETMLNARTMRAWITSKLGNEATAKHMVAVSTNTKAVKEFGIDPSNTFEFWDWVGGRYSVCSAVGVLPLALHFGFPVVEKFLQGARNIDQHFLNTPLHKNIPVLIGLLGVWNSTFLGYGVRAILPYSEALVRFAAHLQQVDMESNGKRVTLNGDLLDYDAGEITFGEPGTNGQHSFYQLIHQGRTIPCDFIAFIKSPNPIDMNGEEVSNHDELMSNFFAQPDALAYGKTEEELKSEGVPPSLIPHKLFPGNRPSISLLFPELNAYTLGQLLAIYEHRTAVQGFIWDINSFDQWGVELGKVLGKKVRQQFEASRKNNAPVQGFNSSTSRMLNLYLQRSSL
jgi:glucose-6-phosphate isomerase